MLAYLNGQYLPRGEAKISVDDRGFLFGDGVYDVIRAVGGRLFEVERHIQRVERGLAELRITEPEGVRPSSLLEVAEHLLRENGLMDGEATVYLQITRGAAPRTHFFPPSGTTPTVYVSVAPFTPPHALRETGAAAITHADIRWMRCDVKTVNLLPNVLAKQRAVEAGAVEAILVRDGVVTEGASTNVFGVIDGELRTHPDSNFILPGITKAVVLELAAELEIPVRETPMRVENLGRVTEMFVTGTTTDVLPIVRLDGRPVAGGHPGPIAQALGEGLAARMAGEPAGIRDWRATD